MFMVASSVVLTVVVLNYHHRTADIHEMPQWVRLCLQGMLNNIVGFVHFSDQNSFSTMVTMDSGNEQARQEDN